MGRYTGPRERLSRRAGVELELKGARRMARKGGLERRPSAPGDHGRNVRRKHSTYGLQLRAKQSAKHYYGVRERQFRRYVREARRGDETRAGERLLQLLEQRLDNVLVRLGFAATRAQARQFVAHGHVQVDGRRCDIPSRRLERGAVVALAPDSPVLPLARRAADLVDRVPAWLTADQESLVGRVERLPRRREIQAPLDEQPIIELYSRT